MIMENWQDLQSRLDRVRAERDGALEQLDILARICGRPDIGAFVLGAAVGFLAALLVGLL